MASTTTQMQIVNRGLQLLGSKSISSLQENSNGARAMNRAYQPTFLNELRENFWRFSIKRAQLAISATKPLFGIGNYFPLPPDFLMMAPNDTAMTNNGIVGAEFVTGPRDWQIENMGDQIAIVSNDTGPLNLRYVSSAVTESMFDVSFAEMLSASLAMNTCEEITQSNTKMANAEKFYDNANEQAKKRNAFELPPMSSPTDSWLLARR